MSTRRVHLATGPVDIVVDNSTAGDPVGATFWHSFLTLFVVQMVNGLGDRREQNKSNCGWKLNCAFFDIERDILYR